MENNKNLNKEVAKKLTDFVRKSDNFQADFEEGMKKVWEGIADIFENSLKGKRILRTQYLILYDSIHSYLVGLRQADVAIENITESENLTCNDALKELYKKLTVLLETTVQKICENAVEISGNEFLSFYERNWNDFHRSCSLLNGICGYLNRYFTSFEITGTDNMFEVYQLGMITWKNGFFINFEQQITSSLLKLIEEDRKGEVINLSTLSSVIDSYIKLDTYNYKDPFFNYVKYFENIFIKTSAEFYTKESSDLLRHNSIHEYMKKVDERLNQEAQRVEIYMRKRTHERLQTTCGEIFITNHLNIILDEFKNLLNTKKMENISLIYLLLEKIPNGLEKLREVLEEHIWGEGLTTLEMCANTAIKDPGIYIRKIANIHQRFKNLINEAFNGDIQFIGSLDKACVRFINNNAVTNACKSSTVIPELLAKHCDLLLKMKNKDFVETELEDALNQAITVFTYIDDKDVFEKLYSKYLAKRLINQISTSNDVERLMILKMKKSCGWQYISKLQRMFQDIEISKDLCEEFRQTLETSIEPLEVDFKVQVLSSHDWMLKQSAWFNLPSELENSRLLFESFYKAQHCGRKLSWHLNLSTGELQTTCFKNKYTFHVSTMQMSILLMYNNRLSYMVQDLQEATGIDMKFIILVLQILLKFKLLYCDEEKNLQLTSVVSLFMGYKNKKLRVNINVPLKRDKKVEQEVVEKHIKENRKFKVQIAIVRVMKMKKKLEHQQLITEVLNQFSDKFRANISLIENCISILIEREYIKHSAEVDDCYEYVA